MCVRKRASYNYIVHRTDPGFFHGIKCDRSRRGGGLPFKDTVLIRVRYYFSLESMY